MMKFKKGILAGLLMAGVLISYTVNAGVRPQLTRIVAYATDKETPVEVINDSSETYMLQSWLEDLQGQDNNIPLVLTPPVMKIEGKKHGKLRLVVMKSEIPQDRESVYWLSLQEIPPKAKNGADNRLVVAVRSRLKVFVRPDGLNAAGAREAAKQLTWRVEQEGGKRWLTATNPSAYYISFGELSISQGGGNKVSVAGKTRMPPPKGSQRYPLPESMKGGKLTVTWTATHDWGGQGETLKREVIL